MYKIDRRGGGLGGGPKIVNLKITSSFYKIEISEVKMVMKGKKGKGKKVAAAPLAVKKMEQKRVVNPLFEKRPKNFNIGQV